MSQLISVLIADDEPDVRMLLEFQLELEDDLAVAGTAADGIEVLEQCRQDPPDVVVMDLLMPRMTGLDAIVHLREDHPDVAIVAYTAVAGDFVREQMRKHDVELVLKSGDTRPLLAALRRAIDGPSGNGSSGGGAHDADDTDGA